MIVCRDDVARHPEGTPLEVPRGTLFSQAALEEAARRGIEIVEKDEPARPACRCGAIEGGRCACEGPDLPSPMPPPSPSAAAPSADGGWEARLPPARVDLEALRPGGSAPQAASRAGRRVSAAGGGAQPGSDPFLEAELRLAGPRPTHVDACLLGSGGECREGTVVVTAVGRNRPRVLAEIASRIADLGGDIQDISQRIVDGWFYTLFTVDMSRASLPFREAKRALEELGREGDYRVRVQNERVFRSMHRI